MSAQISAPSRDVLRYPPNGIWEKTWRINLKWFLCFWFYIRSGTEPLFSKCLLNELSVINLVLCFRKELTTWTCATGWWGAYSAVAPGRPSLPVRWCAMLISMQHRSSTCCIIRSATSSELPMSWWVNRAQGHYLWLRYTVKAKFCNWLSAWHRKV